FARDPQGVMRQVLANPPHDRILFRSQHVFVTGPSGEVLADEIGRVEDMQASYDRMCARIGIPSEALERANSSRHEGYRGYYDKSQKAGVTALYAKDLEIFGYSF